MSSVNRIIVGLVRQFSTPVASIEGAAWVLDDPHLPEDKRRELVGIVRKEAHRLTRLLSDAVDFMQPRPPRFRMINLSTLVDEVIQLADTRGLGNSYIFTTNIPPALPPLRCDPEQIKQVLLNLVVNSIQATAAGGRIEISARIEGDHFVIVVKDHGRGIPTPVLDRIFDPFFTTNEHHLGLGLSVALRIVTDHRGRMAVDCQQSGGTCISVILPAKATPLVT
jgi:signal transduction histidine kinase